MQVLLPPSEAKSAGGRGRPLRDKLVPDPLGAARARVAAAVHELVTGEHDAAAALMLPPAAVAGALAANARILDSPTTPALRRYTGTVYDGLDLARMSTAEQRTAGRTLHVFSGLLGVVRGDEPVPRYRVPAKAVLPGIGVAATFWRPVLAEVLPDRFSQGLIVDLRSGDYAAMWRPGRFDRERVVTVRVLSPLPDGRRGVVSYPSKLAKGKLAAALVARRCAGEPVAHVEHVAEAWIACGGRDAVVTPSGGLELHTH